MVLQNFNDERGTALPGSTLCWSWLTASGFRFGLRFVLREQTLAHGDPTEHGVEDETAYRAAFQFSSASDSFGFLLGAADEKSSFLVPWHGHLLA